VRRRGPPWNRIAPFYDLQLRLERPALRVAADLLAPRADERVLDVGTGTAGFLCELARRDDRPAEALGVDREPAMLRRAPSLPRGWRLATGDATALPATSNSFDAAACTYLLHLLSPADVEPALAELHRVLRLGGRLVTVTPTPPPSWLESPYRRAASGLANLSPTLFAGLRPYDPGASLERTGFSRVRGRIVSRGYPSLCVLSVATSPSETPSLSNAP
jgi:ubiquinone/menaquinone biosynthesis C-methylase UbiE